MSCFSSLFPVRLPPAIIRASAGTGKTYQLSNRFLQLIDLGVPAHQILAVTFTRKAAGEIFERVVERLVLAAQESKPREAFAQAIGYESIDADYCLALLERITRQLHQLEVGTLDSYFLHAAQSLPAGQELATDWSIADESQQEALWEAAVQRLLEADGSPDVRQIVHWLCHGDASRGVTQVMMRTVADVYGLFQSSRRFGESAWHLAAAGTRLDESSLSNAMRRLRDLQSDSQHLLNARDKAIRQIEDGAWESFLTKGIAAGIRRDGRYYRQKIPHDWIEAYQPLLEHARAVLVAAHADHTLAAYHLLCRFDVAYQQLKRERRVFDFDDFPRRLVEVDTARSAGSGWQARDWDDPRIEHLLLDEFQDTSILQWYALRGMARRTASAASPETSRSFLCVGDVKQSIYGWRGGVPELLEGLSAQLPSAELQDLDRSFRSAPVIIDLVNDLFTSLPERTSLHPYRRPIARWCRRFRLHSTARCESGHVTIRSVPESEDGRSTIAASADLVQALSARHPNASIGVLVLKNETVAELIYALRARGLTASEEGGQPLTDSAAVQLVLSMLWLTEHPGDSVARFHVAHSELGSAVGVLPTNWQRSGDIAVVANRWRRRLFERGLGAVLEDWASRLRPACSAHEWRRLQQLIDQALEWDRHGWTSVVPFVERIRILRIGSPVATDIRVMTVHKSKGLQFDIVVVTGLDRKLVDPPAFAMQRDKETHEVKRVVRYCNQTLQEFLPEEVRQTCQATIDELVEERLSVLYVALTRAQRALHIVMQDSKRSGGEEVSLSGLIRVALSTAESSPRPGIWWERGDPAWHSPVAAPSLPPVVVRAEPPAPPTTRQDEVFPTRDCEFVSPSQLEGPPNCEVARLFDPQRSTALQLGTIVHRFLEQVTWWSADLESPDKVREWLQRYCGLPDGPSANWSEELVVWLNSDSLQQVLRQDCYRSCMAARVSTVAGWELSVRNEQSLAAQVEDVWLSGIVDRLVLASEHGELQWAHVIDYKTDQVPPDNLAALTDRVQFYRPQLQAYRSMAAAALGLPHDRVLADLCFVQANQMVPIDADDHAPGGHTR